MPRQARVQSPTGVYHAMVRGIGKMNIFMDDKDRLKYLDSLNRFKDKGRYFLLAYCLMDNHVHLLLKEGTENLAATMKRLGVSYAMHFNNRYQRPGHLFQNRYKSEPIDSEQQFMVCARYIHNNPVQAGLVKTPESYRWSSYSAYLNPAANTMVSTQMLLKLYSEDEAQARADLQEFTESEAAEQPEFIDAEPELSKAERLERLTSNVKQILAAYGLTIADLQSMRGSKRAKLLRELKAQTDGSVRTLSNVLGLNKDTIQKA